MKLGDWIKVPDGRIGTVVYSSLEGFGVIWGKRKISLENQEMILGICPLFKSNIRGYKFAPQAMLRDKRLTKLLRMECVGDEKICKIIGNGCETEEGL